MPRRANNRPRFLPMRRVCAWCRQPMGEPSESEEVTHGICDGCFKRQIVGVKAAARFSTHPQSGEMPVIQVWREDEFGSAAWTWVRTPADILSLTPEELAAIKNLAS